MLHFEHCIEKRTPLGREVGWRYSNRVISIPASARPRWTIPVYLRVDDDDTAAWRTSLDWRPVINTSTANSLTKGEIRCGSRLASEKANASENLNLQQAGLGGQN